MKYTLGLTLLMTLGLTLGACSGDKKDKSGDDTAAKKTGAAEASKDKAASGDKVAAKKADTKDKAGAKADAPKVDVPALPAGPIAKVNGVEVSKDEFQRKFDKMTRAFTRRTVS